MNSPPKALDPLREPAVRTALANAWVESKPGLTGGHEEGGFVVLDVDGKLAARRWPAGAGNLIQVPPHVGCEVNGLPIVASFHTHPNTGPDYLQEPGETDRRGVRDDPDLQGRLYAGELVLSDETIYLISPGGMVRELGSRAELLG